MRDEELIPQLVELWESNYRVYGSASSGRQPARGDHNRPRSDRQTDARRRGRCEDVEAREDHTANPASSRHPDLVKREFIATAPNRLWVTDLTFVPIWAGVAYVCSIIDAFSRMIVGWRVASHMRTEMVATVW